ncbi:MAG: type III-B CRISPR module RAMP protein Cmr4 [Oscillatoriales cyanobacterium RM2_1_1]|nr:type III-B CRISPR module RAMP protein Cmr4 [Oscillatoriales cyanobacterium SM2_3_0]NJO47925.1 type III-B CRISPR module RAMP protein Cmr4 [Oscillatoriales cyanobacterium RM2_1_1]
MYNKGYGIIETLAPLHVGASAGEETGNLNLIFRDQFTQTGIVPGSSIRGRFRADMRLKEQDENGQPLSQNGGNKYPLTNTWYGHETIEGPDKPKDGGTTEALVKFEYASLVWFPVFCPGQPVVWISCPRLLKRYKLIAGIQAEVPEPYTACKTLQARQLGTSKPVLFFNLGFMEIEHEKDPGTLKSWIPAGVDLEESNLVVVGDNDISMLHDMGLYRQSRVKLLDEMKKVDTDRGAFFNTEALPEGSVLVFPVATRKDGWTEALLTSDQSIGAGLELADPDSTWQQLSRENTGEKTNDMIQKELYFGGLESVGFGRCRVTVKAV